MSFALKHDEDLETTGNWRLVRRSVGLDSFGVNVVDIPSGEQIPEHDETGRDQEELFFVVAGTPTFVIDGEDHATKPGTCARLDPEHTRTVRNDAGETARVLIASAPRTSGYEAMGWA